MAGPPVRGRNYARNLFAPIGQAHDWHDCDRLRDAIAIPADKQANQICILLKCSGSSHSGNITRSPRSRGDDREQPV